MVKQKVFSNSKKKNNLLISLAFIKRTPNAINLLASSKSLRASCMRASCIDYEKISLLHMICICK